MNFFTVLLLDHLRFLTSLGNHSRFTENNLLNADFSFCPLPRKIFLTFGEKKSPERVSLNCCG